ncbi:MAG TPA: hypothetical protein VMV08_09480 [Gaiellaceae bacterium]|nr:hypothetical protein [Gaiellaceae bacterium]
MLWLLLLLPLVAAIGGGLVVSRFLFLVLIAVLIVAAIGGVGRRTVEQEAFRGSRRSGR